jgi:predicted SprT family Zn-dependent metalloprotease
MMSKYNLPALQAFADKIAVEFWTKAKRIFREDIGELPKVKLNARLTSTGGRAFIDLGYIDLSCYLLERNPEYYREDTIPHELCHIIAWRIYGDRGHGKGWKYVMLQTGVNGKRCHTMQTKYQAERNTK